LKKILFFICASLSLGVRATDVYDGKILSIPHVFVGGALYANVQITVGKVLSVEGGDASNIYDQYNTSNNQLIIPAVNVGSNHYTNVVIEVGSVVSVGQLKLTLPSKTLNTATWLTVENAVGTIHSTGVIPFDLNSDGITDLVFTPATLNSGPDRKAFSVLNTGDSFIVQANGAWNKPVTTGFVKDWTLRDLNADGTVDIAWIDHGLELPADQGGFENGLNAALLSQSKGAFAYKPLSTLKSFNHGLTSIYPSGNTNSLIVADFQSRLKQYTIDNKGDFQELDFPLGDEFAYSKPGAVASVKLKNTANTIVAASYTRPNPQWDPNGAIVVYAYDGKSIGKIDRFDFPLSWKTDNLGAFAIIAADFRGCGCDDFLVLGETVDLNNYKRDVLYYQQDNGKFVDMTDKYLSQVKDLINQPDKLVPIDVNQDGFMDLVGFSYKVGLYANGAGVFLNDGTGKFTSQKFGPITLSHIANFPIFSHNPDGSWKSLIGVYGVSTPNTKTLSLISWFANQ